MKGIQFCEVSGGHGGPQVKCSDKFFMYQREIDEFIRLFSKSYDNYFNVYEFNDLGMKYIERLGKCNQYSCDIRYFNISEIKSYRIKDFISGGFENKHYKHISDYVEVVFNDK